MKIYLLQFFLLIGLGLNLQAQIPSNPIRGKVTCNGTGIPGIVVTDGIDCTLTDQQGQYTLPPNRNVRFIYLSTPSGYLPKTEQTIPLFYLKLNPAKQDIYVIFGSNLRICLHQKQMIDLILRISYRKQNKQYLYSIRS